MPFEPTVLARELAAAYQARQAISIPSSRGAGFDLPSAYALEAELVRLRRAAGAQTVGRKVGFANRALWPKFALNTVLWAHMYDDTVHYAIGGAASLGIGRMMAPRIEPEIRQPNADPLVAGEVIATGALTDTRFIAPGDSWTAFIEGLDLPHLTLRATP